jgi:serine/threonine protein kinase/Tfp pilus assembly protein PilF
MTRATQNPRFRQTEVIGQGGTAEVASVYDTKLARRVALKYALPGDSNALKSFENLIRREYDLAGGIRFPGIVRMLEPPPPESDYLLMELCEGPSLDALHRIDDLRAILMILSAVALDLEFLRTAGLVHGDVKPQNVFLPKPWMTYTDGTLFWVKLSDFSLGKLASEADSQRLGLGTVGYLAPETIAEQIVTHRSDLFALGAIGYQLLTGRHPFIDGETEPVRINSRVCEEEPVDLSSLRPDASTELIGLIESLLAKDEQKRPSSAWEVCQQLEHMGSPYPFRQALRPSHFWRYDRSYETNLGAVLDMNAAERERLDMLTDARNECLRLVLTDSYIRRNLVYADGRFQFTTCIHWPARLRNQILSQFSGLSLSQKRSIIHAAVRNSNRLGGTDAEEQSTELPHTAATIQLIRAMLRPVTVKRLSRTLARYAYGENDVGVAARLYTQADDLAEAERCAHQAAIELNRDHRNAEAIRLLDQVIEFAELKEDRFAARHLLMLRGDYLKENGELDAALETYRRLTDLYRGRSPDTLLGETYFDLGVLLRLRREPDRAQVSFERALDIYRELEDDLRVSHVYNSLGNLNWQNAELPTALRYFRHALRIRRRLNARPDIATTLNNMGIVYGIMGRYTRCLRLLDLALSLKRDIGQAGEIARTLNNLAYAHFVTGGVNTAIDCVTESLMINRRIGSNKEILFNLENMTTMLTTIGQLETSMEFVQEGLELSQNLNDKAHYGIFKVGLAVILRRLGRIGEAHEQLVEVRQICHRIDHTLLETALTVEQAWIRLAVGDREAALSIARTAHDRASDVQDMDGLLSALLLITRLTDESTYVDEMELIVGKRHLKREFWLARFNRLDFALEHGRSHETGTLSHDLATYVQSQREEIELPRMYNLLAESFLDQGNETSAEAFIQHALTSAERFRLMPESANAYLLRGRLFDRRGEWERCFGDYRKALALHKQIAGSVPGAEDQKRYQQKRQVQYLARSIKRLSQKLTAS